MTTPPDVAGVALLGDVDPELVHELAQVGLPVRGVLAGDPFDAAPRPRVARHYSGVADLVADARGPLRAVVLPASSPLAPALPDLVAEGLAVLLPDPAPWDAAVLRSARAAAADRDVGVAVLLHERHRGWAALVGGALSGRPAPQQVTVRGWPRGAVAAAELVDLVRAWCGDVVAAAAVPAALPADVLPGGVPVAWSLLTARGSTVLVSHEGGPVQVRLSLPPTRLLAGPDAVGWEGAEAVVPAQRDDPSVAAFAAAVAAGTAEPLELAGGRADGPPGPGRPGVAGLADLVATARVLAALRTSARTETWAELS